MVALLFVLGFCLVGRVGPTWGQQPGESNSRPGPPRPPRMLVDVEAAGDWSDAPRLLAAYREHVPNEQWAAATGWLENRLDAASSVAERRRHVLRMALHLSREGGLYQSKGRPADAAETSRRPIQAQASRVEESHAQKGRPEHREQKQHEQARPEALGVPPKGGAVERQVSETVYEVPFASTNNRVRLTLDEALVDRSPHRSAATTVYAAHVPKGLTLTSPKRREVVPDTASGGASAPFAFEANPEAAVGEERSLVFVVKNGKGQRVAEKAIRLTVTAPEQFALTGNYPNPFQQQTRIGYELPEAAEVTISIYDALGRRVERLSAGRKAAGGHAARVEAESLASGVYFYRVEARPEDGEPQHETGRMVLVR